MSNLQPLAWLNVYCFYACCQNTILSHCFFIFVYIGQLWRKLVICITVMVSDCALLSRSNHLNRISMDSESTWCSSPLKDVDTVDVSACNIENSPVLEFYRGKTVFITGATGFMGKVLVEKLLRCTLVSKIYVLIRPKKGVRSHQRLQDLLAGKIFDTIRKLLMEI